MVADAKKSKMLTEKTQEDLVQMAFTDLDLEDEFIQKTHKVIDIELKV